VFYTGWKRDDAIVSEGLEDLASKVPGILKNSRADNTSKAYLAAFLRWEKWVSSYPEVTAIPANPTHVILYLTYLSNTVGSFASISQFLSALSWAHNLKGHVSPVRDPVVVEVVSGIKRQLACPTIRKEPFSTENIKSLFKIMNTSSLTDIRNTTLIVLAFVAFLRFDEVTNILVKDISFKDSHIELAIPKAKTDQLRQGNVVVIASTGGYSCPVSLLSRYMKSAGFSKSKRDSNFLFTRVIFKNKRLQIFHTGKPMTYSNVRDIVKNKAQQIGLDPKCFSTHSMRSGGATAAAEAGVDERLMQKHGRWALASSKDKYVVDALHKRLGVSKVLLK
jgi:site-specific recombinase XerD